MNFETARETDRVPHGSADDPDLLDFSANVNPVVPDGVEAVYRTAFDTSRTYPPEPPRAFCEAAAGYVGCDPTQIVPTPGGLAAIRLLIDLTVSAGDAVLVPEPSFGEYAREIRLQGGEPTFVSQEQILDADPTDHALAILCNPNNPTGTGYGENVLAAFAERCRDGGTPLLVDEAFLGFTDRPSLAGTPGVMVARSMTKLFGLPGIRCGFAVATGEYREAIENARRPWNLSTPALATGEYCVTQTDFIRKTRQRIRTERKRLREALSERFVVYPSDAPFLLIDVGNEKVKSILVDARSRGVAIRDARTFRGLESHVRIAVRLPRENDRLLEVLLDG